jgi:tetratricopeptide (TPR) repeat protein
VLALLGLFDRPAEAAAIAALKTRPTIAGLNEHLIDLAPGAWNEEIEDLRRLGLLAPVSHHAPNDLDAHPLVREHFGERLKTEKPEAWRAGHGRLYEHLKTSARPLPDTVAEMASLFQAMHHGCQAGRHQEVLDEVYIRRIQRGDEGYNPKKLGAIAAELAAIAGLFDPPWQKPLATLTEAAQAFILNEAALDLRALGRLWEAVAPMRASLDACVSMQDWKQAAVRARNASVLLLTLGDTAGAVAIIGANVEYADRSGDPFERVCKRTAWANALHQAGEAARAKALFEEAEVLQAGWQPGYPQLYSLQGYQYCDLLLAQGRATEVRERAAQALEWALLGRQGPLLDVALDHLSLGQGGAGAPRPRGGQGAAQSSGRRAAPSGRHHISTPRIARPCGTIPRDRRFSRRSARSGRGDADRQALRDAALPVRCPSRIRPARAQGGGRPR